MHLVPDSFIDSDIRPGREENLACIFGQADPPSGGKGAQRDDAVKNGLCDLAGCFRVVFGDVPDDACQIFSCRLGPSDKH